jgi:CBS domain-containing protein
MAYDSGLSECAPPLPERPTFRRATGISHRGENMIAKTVGTVIRGKKIQELVSVRGSATVSDAVAAMTKKGVGAIVIVGANGAVEGIFTERDVMARVVNENRDARTTPVSTVMSPNVRRVAASARLEDALSLMVVHGYRHLLVEEGGRIEGLLSIRDLMSSMVIPETPIAHEGRVGVIRARAGETLEMVEKFKSGTEPKA